ncbi:MAG: site-specific integrase [Elusimicrobiota bacterium]
MGVAGVAVFKRKDRPDDERWWIGYKLPNGRYRREPVGFKHKQAREVLAKRIGQSVDGREFTERKAMRQKFSALMDWFWSLYGCKYKSPSWKAYKNRLLARFGNRLVGDISGEDVIRFYDAEGRRTSPQNANRHLTLLKRVFNKARRTRRYRGENPCDAVEPIGEAQFARERELAEEEFQRLYLCLSDKIRPVFDFAVLSGSRRKENLYLDWKQVDLEREIIRLYQYKTGKWKIVPIRAKLRALLEKQSPKKEGRVFNVSPKTLYRHFKKAKEQAGIEDFRFHDLRHFFSSVFYKATGDLYAAEKLLGVSGSAMAKRYTQLSEKHLAEKMELFESIVPLDPSSENGMQTLHRA